MVEFETVKAEEIEFGRNNFIEIARKIAKTEEGETEYISLSRGYYLPDKSKKFKTSIALPTEKDKLEKIAELINTM